MTEDRDQMTDDRGQRMEVRCLMTDDKIHAGPLYLSSVI